MGRRGGGDVVENAELDPFAGASDPNKALLYRLVAVPALRTRYLGYMRDIGERWLDWNRIGPLAGEFQSVIAADVKADTRKIFSTAAFSQFPGGIGCGARIVPNMSSIITPRSIGLPPGTPIVDAPTSWQYLLWKYEYDIARAATEPVSLAHLLITRALQSTTQDNRLRVLRASPEALIELRRNGALEELRAMLRTGIQEITAAAPSDLENVTNAIAANINSAMLEHQKKLDGLVRSGIRWYGLEVAPMIVSASISILGAANGNVALSTIGAVISALGVPTLKDVVKEGQSILDENKRLNRSAAGILFRNR